MKQETTCSDFFDIPLEIGDRYFFGNPPTFGRVIKVTKRGAMLETGSCRWTGANTTMNVKDASNGICIDKVPKDK